MTLHVGYSGSMGNVIFLTIVLSSVVASVVVARVFFGRRKMAYQEVPVRVRR